VIVVIISGVASHSREFHGLTPESDGSTAVKTHNNHYQEASVKLQSQKALGALAGHADREVVTVGRFISRNRVS
jgi:hypothetical protein